MELIGYYNYEDKFEYDDNGFLIPPIDNSFIIFDSIQKGSEYIKSDNYPEQALLKVYLELKDDIKYVYNISIIEEGTDFDFLSYGKVEIHYNYINDDISTIKKIIVNGISNGILKDKYDDCFDIRPSKYIHILHKYSQNEDK